MDLVVAWIVFPALLGALCLGCGLAVEGAAGRRLPASLLVPVGFAACVVLGQFTTLGDATAELTAPLLVMVALVGLGLAVTGRRALRPPVALVVGLGVLFAVYAAPVVLSGQTTLAGFIKLDDTATWLTFTDQLMTSGRDLSGLAASTYQRTLDFNIGQGYPVGVFVPFGAGVELLGTDSAWLIQPYMAFLALLFALSAWSLTSRLVTRLWPRAATVALAAQPALIYGYYLWGGVKELAAAALIATVAATASFALSRAKSFRALVPLAFATGALVGVLSPGGLIWALPVLLAALGLVAVRLGIAAAAGRAAAFAAALIVFALPVLIPGGIKPPTSSPLSDAEAKGNLIEPLDPVQIAGVWPSGDFRLPLDGVGEIAGYGLIALAVGLVLLGGFWIARERELGVGALALAGVVGFTALYAIGSPWVDGKSMATASPFFMLVALLGCAALGRLTRPAAAIAAFAVLGAGVLWSNALQYRDVNLAPHDQFAELEEIGDLIETDGPALMTEYSPYGARHFLRRADPESISELRFRQIPLRNGNLVEKGSSADTDAIDPGALALYRTLVLRRSPAQSRPPAGYELVYSGSYYEAWQRPAGVGSVPERLPLGDQYDPVAEPNCERVKSLATSGGDLVAATGVAPVVVPLSQTDYPRSWRRPGLPFAPAPDSAGSIEVSVRVNRPDEYEIWLGESVKPQVQLFVDGEPSGEVRHQLNNYGGYVRLGSATLEPGVHEIEARFSGPDLAPGSGGVADPIGPLTLSGAEAAESRLVRVAAADAETLCGREWDWIEVAAG